MFETSEKCRSLSTHKVELFSYLLEIHEHDSTNKSPLYNRKYSQISSKRQMISLIYRELEFRRKRNVCICLV